MLTSYELHKKLSLFISGSTSPQDEQLSDLGLIKESYEKDLSKQMNRDVTYKISELRFHYVSAVISVDILCACT